MFRMGWVVDYADPDNFLYVLLHSEKLGVLREIMLHYKNPEVDRLLAESPGRDRGCKTAGALPEGGGAYRRRCPLGLPFPLQPPAFSLRTGLRTFTFLPWETTPRLSTTCGKPKNSSPLFRNFYGPVEICLFSRPFLQLKMALTFFCFGNSSLPERVGK